MNHTIVSFLGSVKSTVTASAVSSDTIMLFMAINKVPALVWIVYAQPENAASVVVVIVACDMENVARSVVDLCIFHTHEAVRVT